MPRVVEVELNPVTKKLVVRMEDGFGREGIESLGVMNGDEAVAIDTGLLKKAPQLHRFTRGYGGHGWVWLSSIWGVPPAGGPFMWALPDGGISLNKKSTQPRLWTTTTFL